MSLLAALFSIILLFCSPVKAEGEPKIVKIASAPAEVGTLMPSDIQQSIATHYPIILAAIQDRTASQARVQEQLGAFDATIEQRGTSRLSGFYDGQQLDTRIVQPLAPFNSRVYGGYRISDGNFPIYEDELITNDEGEIMLGAELSLLRGNMIDRRRADLNIAEIRADNAEIDLTITQLKVQLESLMRYWRWVEAGKQLNVLESILSLMQQRQKGLEKRFEKGDVAEIFLTENQQYITQRKGQIVNARRALKEAAFRLSLFYRDTVGEPVIPEHKMLPAHYPEPEAMQELALLRQAISQHPELQRLLQEQRENEQILALGENELLPKADIQFEYSDDFGAGSITRQQAESVVKLNISIPLETNRARGQINRAKAELKRLDHMAQLRAEELQMQLANLLMELKARSEAISLTEDEISFAQQMEAAERKRFRAGGSDFFLINLRETALANARINHIEAHTQYQLALTKLDVLTMNAAKTAADPMSALP